MRNYGRNTLLSTLWAAMLRVVSVTKTVVSVTAMSPVPRGSAVKQIAHLDAWMENLSIDVL